MHTRARHTCTLPHAHAHARYAHATLHYTRTAHTCTRPHAHNTTHTPSTFGLVICRSEEWARGGTSHRRMHFTLHTYCARMRTPDTHKHVRSRDLSQRRKGARSMLLAPVHIITRTHARTHAHACTHSHHTHAPCTLGLVICRSK